MSSSGDERAKDDDGAAGKVNVSAEPLFFAREIWWMHCLSEGEEELFIPITRTVLSFPETARRCPSVAHAMDVRGTEGEKRSVASQGDCGQAEWSGYTGAGLEGMRETERVCAWSGIEAAFLAAELRVASMGLVFVGAVFLSPILRGFFMISP